MSKEKDKNKQENKGSQVKKHVITAIESFTKRSHTTKEEWSKIDKKGQGAGDRPKK